MKISSRHILKSAEVYGAEATVYTGSRSEPEDFLRFTVGGEWNPGGVQGSTYGKGLYSVYNLEGTNTSRGGYGRWIYKLRVNLYGFISFNEDITQKIYGSKLKPSQQYRMVYGENKLILPLLEELEKNNVGSYTSAIAEPASKFLRGIVKGILFTGEQDGDVAVIYDANVVTPISYKHLDGDGEWKKFEKEKVKESIGRGMAGSFEPKKYHQKYHQDEDEGEDEADEIPRIFVNHINSLSGDESKLDNKSLRYVYYLIKNNPIEFLNQFSEKPWAIEARPELKGMSYIDIATADIRVKTYAEQNPIEFLNQFSEKPWAEPYRNDAAEFYVKKDPFGFLYNFSEKPWAEPYINGAAEFYVKKDPFIFLYNFAEKPWAIEARPELEGKSYLDLAREALNAKGLNQTASQVNTKLLKLAEVLRNLKTEGLNKEISQIKDLARNRY